jgi:hypothetical protein
MTIFQIGLVVLGILIVVIPFLIYLIFLLFTNDYAEEQGVESTAYLKTVEISETIEV